jgi:hypothetical protein
MSKKKTPSKVEQPGYVTELLEKGTVILTAEDREDFGELIDQIPASVRYAAGAIGKNPTTGLYQLRIDIIND